MSGYRRGYGRRTYAVTTGRIAKSNARPGTCRGCGVEIPAHGGQLYREQDGSWSVVHTAAKWAGSPVSGRYVGGCPDETGRLNAGPTDAEQEAGRQLSADAMAAVAALAWQDAPRDSRGGYIDECGSCGMASCAC